MYNPFSLEGKTILVTGASSGIGRATAIECARLGATLILTGRNVQNLHETLQVLEGGKGHRVIAADLSNEDECGELVASLPILDGFVCNAGIGKMIPVQFYSSDVLEEVFGVNVFAPMLLIKLLVRKKKMKNPSSVVLRLLFPLMEMWLLPMGFMGLQRAH